MLNNADREIVEKTTIMVATGILMARNDSTQSAATARLHDLAQTTRIPVFDMASIIITTHPPLP